MGNHGTVVSDLFPLHVGIIMDGNGRWAQARGLSRSAGHKEGLTAAKRITKAAVALGIKYLSLYLFSTENWKRAQEEVSFLMVLIKDHLKKEYNFYKENGIRVVHSGAIEGLPGEIQKQIAEIQEETKDFQSMTVNLAINYGGQDEIVRAVNRWKAASPQATLTLEELNQHLDVPELPPVDLIIRTGGDQRISNFLLWRSAYSEFFFSNKFWPDWQESDLLESLNNFKRRLRKFGGTNG